ncbi:MAG: hypothetical protein AB3K77_10015 [Methanosarcinaceae archaeon]
MKDSNESEMQKVRRNKIRWRKSDLKSPDEKIRPERKAKKSPINNSGSPEYE